MNPRNAVFALALAGCGAKVEAPSCRDAVAAASARLGGDVERGVAMCTRDRWSPEVRACVAAAATRDALVACTVGTVHPAPRPGPRAASDDAIAVTRALVRRYARDAFPLWRAHHGGRGCPATIDELVDLVSGTRTDPWGHLPIAVCDGLPAGVEFGALSLGLDGVRGTADDIRSWDP